MYEVQIINTVQKHGDRTLHSPAPNERSTSIDQHSGVRVECGHSRRQAAGGETDSNNNVPTRVARTGQHNRPHAFIILRDQTDISKRNISFRFNYK